MLNGDHRGLTYATAGSSPLLAGVTGTAASLSPRRPLSLPEADVSRGLSPGHVPNRRLSPQRGEATFLDPV
jgi:hypothetical protein